MTCPYETGGQRRLTTVFGSDAAATEEALRRLWPLRVGNKVSFASTVSSGTLLNQIYRVVRHEVVTVAAGSFDAFVIERDIRASGYHVVAFDEHATYWYAPEVGDVVKFADEVRGGSYPQTKADEAVRIVEQ